MAGREIKLIDYFHPSIGFCQGAEALKTVDYSYVKLTKLPFQVSSIHGN